MAVAVCHSPRALLVSSVSNKSTPLHVNLTIFAKSYSAQSIPCLWLALYRRFDWPASQPKGARSVASQPRSLSRLTVLHSGSFDYPNQPLVKRSEPSVDSIPPQIFASASNGKVDIHIRQRIDREVGRGGGIDAEVLFGQMANLMCSSAFGPVRILSRTGHSLCLSHDGHQNRHRR
jgi:hypothetical protein